MGSTHDVPTEKKGQESCLNFKILRNFRKDEKGITSKTPSSWTKLHKKELYFCSRKPAVIPLPLHYIRNNGITLQVSNNFNLQQTLYVLTYVYLHSWLICNIYLLYRGLASSRRRRLLHSKLQLMFLRSQQRLYQEPFI